MTSSRSSSRTTSVLFLVAGEPARLTGGNIYDAHVIRALRRSRVTVSVAPVRDASDTARALARARPRVVVADSIAFHAIGGALDRHPARVVALVHMPVSGRRARAVLTRADRVVAVSASLARALAARRVRVIPPGSDGVAVVRRRARRDGLRVLCVANWSRAKGVDLLVRAAAHAAGLRLDLVGDRPDPAYARGVRRMLMELDDSAVVVHGPLRAAALARAYADADVVAVPSRSEGYGIVASEALAHGRPVVAADLPPLRAIVGRAGILFPPSDVRALARALDRLRDAALRRRLAAHARVRARSLPRWRDTERSFVALVEEEMQRRPRVGGDHMPPRGVKSKKRTRQYEHIKQSEMKRGRSTKVAKRIAAATTNKTRRKKGETKSRSRKKS